MVYTETVTQEIHVRFTDGVITGAMVTEQDHYIDDETYELIGRSKLKLRDLVPQALADIATILECGYYPKEKPVTTLPEPVTTLPTV